MHHHDPTGSGTGKTFQSSCCGPAQQKPEYLLWLSVSIITMSCLLYLVVPELSKANTYLFTFTQSITQLLHQMVWGILLGFFFVGVVARMPQQLITTILGTGGTVTGVLRATAAGVLLDMCSHGILMVGAQLYKRGASMGQVAAFLIASPWNSFSLTLILWALVGFKWMILLLIFSALIAIVTGITFDILVKKQILPNNPNTITLQANQHAWQIVKHGLQQVRFTPQFWFRIIWEGVLGSKMVLKWIFFGIILAAAVRTFVPPDAFATYFGPSLAGLVLTVLIATVLEVCSEGTLPVAADILTKAGAPGNAFAFLMTGVSTDYTEILVLKETTKSWKISLFLPLLTVPQVLFIAWLMNATT